MDQWCPVCRILSFGVFFSNIEHLLHASKHTYTSLLCSQIPLPVISGQFRTTTDTNRNQATPTDVPDTHNTITTHFVSQASLTVIFTYSFPDSIFFSLIWLLICKYEEVEMTFNLNSNEIWYDLCDMFALSNHNGPWNWLTSSIFQRWAIILWYAQKSNCHLRISRKTKI